MTGHGGPLSRPAPTLSSEVPGFGSRLTIFDISPENAAVLSLADAAGGVAAVSDGPRTCGLRAEAHSAKVEARRQDSSGIDRSDSSRSEE